MSEEMSLIFVYMLVMMFAWISVIKSLLADSLGYKDMIYMSCIAFLLALIWPITVLAGIIISDCRRQ